MSEKDEYDDWINRWKCCQHEVLVSAFHKSLTKSLTLYRYQHYDLLEEEWEQICGEFDSENDEVHLRVHMSIKEDICEGEKTPQFIPLVQAMKRTGGEYEEGELFSFKPGEIPSSLDPSNEPSGDTGDKVPKAFQKQVCQRWNAIHPGYIADQFAVLEPYSNENDLKRRTRVNFFQYDASAFKEMKDFGDVKKVCFLLGVNHNNDTEDRPSFVPILQLVRPSDESSANEEEKEAFWEYAQPCPPICPDDKGNIISIG